MKEVSVPEVASAAQRGDVDVLARALEGPATLAIARVVALGSGVVASGAGLIFGGPDARWIILGAGCALGIAIVVVARRRDVAARLLDGAETAASARAFDTAYALLDRAERRASTSTIRVGADVRRGAIALTCGWVEEAVTELDHALMKRSSWLGGVARAQLEARSLRALAHALAGAHGRARDDVALLRRALDAGHRGFVFDEQKLGEWLARAALAEVVVASQMGGDVASVVRAHRDLVLRWAAPRERALLRAIAGAKRSSVAASPYRGAGTARVRLRTARDWVGAFVPDAVVGVERREGIALPPRPRATVDTAWRAPRGGSVEGQSMIFAGFCVIAAAFSVVWTVVERGASNDADAMAPPTLLVLAACVGALVVAVARVVGRREARASNLRALRLVRDAPRAIDAIAAARPLGASSKIARLAALSRDALHCGKAADARDHARAALDLAALRTGEPDDVMGRLGDLHATALAAGGQNTAALDALDALPFAYAARGAARVRVELLIALRMNRFDDATRVAESVTDDLPIDAWTEVLVDLLLVRRAEAVDPELRSAARARLRDELSAPDLRVFVEAIAPQLLRDLDRPDR